MSKRKTISHGERFHFFRDNEDTDAVFIEIEDIKECSFELWQMPNDKQMSRALVKIPVEIWKKMVEDWMNKPIGQDNDKKVATFD
jgi:hypothetical protein